VVKGDESDMPSRPQDRPPAIALEDDDSHVHVGEEAYAPIDTGRGPADEDLDPPDLTPEQEEEEEASASAGDEELSEEVPEP
jgi:hypothetical protein